MECNYIEIGGRVNDVFKRNIIVTLDKKQEAINKQNFTDTYSTIYKYDNKQQDGANIIAPMYIDLDIDNLEKDFEKLKRDVLLITRKLTTMFHITEDDIQYYFSGSKGFHIIIPYEIFGIKPSRDLNAKYKTLAIELKSYTITKSVDTRIYDTKRLFREPNTINTKTNLYKVQMTLEQIRNISYNELLDYASSPQELFDIKPKYNQKAELAFNSLIEQTKEKQKRSINHKVARQMLENKEILPCIKYVLQNGAIKGGRNNTAMALASALFQRNDDKEYIEDIMQTWNNTKLDEPLPQSELQATIRSAYNNVASGRRYGCTAFIDMGICVKGCPIRRK